MAKWTVALFGHYKPKYELREIEYSDHIPIVSYGYRGNPYYYLASSFTEVGRGYAGTGYHEMTKDIKLAGTVKIQKRVGVYIDEPTNFDNGRYFIYNVVGWEKRACPGDIIAFKPDKESWTLKEKSEFLTITLDNLEQFQMDAVCESYWDTNDYEVIDPKTIKKQVELYPQSHLKKRRFYIPINDLKFLGVDESKMLDKELEYAPKLRDIDKLECFDKLNNRYVNVSDNLETIKPIIVKPSGTI